MPRFFSRLAEGDLEIYYVISSFPSARKFRRFEAINSGPKGIANLPAGLRGSKDMGIGQKFEAAKGRVEEFAKTVVPQGMTVEVKDPEGLGAAYRWWLGANERRTKTFHPQMRVHSKIVVSFNFTPLLMEAAAEIRPSVINGEVSLPVETWVDGELTSSLETRSWRAAVPDEIPAWLPQPVRVEAPERFVALPTVPWGGSARPTLLFESDAREIWRLVKEVQFEKILELNQLVR